MRAQARLDGTQRIRLDDATVLAGLGVVVLAQGQLPVRSSRRQDELGDFAAAHGLGYVLLGRGGRFERLDGRLVYLPSALEPQMVAGSRRARHEPAVLTVEVIAELRERARRRGGIDFRETV